MTSCGTDVKPNYFIGMFRNSSDIDRLSTCLNSMPVVDDQDNITITANSQCLVDLSKRDTSDPNMDVSYTEILNDPEAYMDRILTFEAVVKRMHGSSSPELYTNRKDIEFHITGHGSDLFWIDEEGEEQDIIENEKYRFQCRIYEIKINTSGRWRIQSEFIISSSKQIVYPPVPIDFQ